MEEADIWRFPNRAKVEEIATKDSISAKTKIISADLSKSVVKKVVVGVLFLSFIVYAKVCGDAT